MRIAHFSDLHLLSLDGVGVRDFLNKRVLGGMNLLFNRGRHYRAEVFEALVADINGQAIDHVICSGDVTNLALAGEFRFARELFEKLALAGRDVTCVPGNHDAYVIEVEGLFEKIFAPFCSSDPGFATHNGVPWPLVRVRGDLAVVGLSTSHATGWLMAHGELGRAQLTALERVLTDERLCGKCRVVVLHHPPSGKWAESFLRGLRDHEGFAQVLARTGAELVLHGHEHLPVRAELVGPGGTIPVRGIQSGSYDKGAPSWRRARYRIYEIAAATNGTRATVAAVATRVFAPSGFVSDAAAVAEL